MQSSGRAGGRDREREREESKGREGEQESEKRERGREKNPQWSTRAKVTQIETVLSETRDRLA